jgi:hypothetical protein
MTGAGQAEEHFLVIFPRRGAGEEALFPGGFKPRRHPGSAVEEAAEGIELAGAPFGGGGEVGLDDGEVGQSVESAPAAS